MNVEAASSYTYHFTQKTHREKVRWWGKRHTPESNKRTCYTSRIENKESISGGYINGPESISCSYTPCIHPPPTPPL